MIYIFLQETPKDFRRIKDHNRHHDHHQSHHQHHHDDNDQEVETMRSPQEEKVKSAASSWEVSHQFYLKSCQLSNHLNEIFI